MRGTDLLIHPRAVKVVGGLRHGFLLYSQFLRRSRRSFVISKREEEEKGDRKYKVGRTPVLGI
jgi:hypothetical protein